MFGGERGIRTLGTLRFTAFRERPVQPLLHLSNRSIVTEWSHSLLMLLMRFETGYFTIHPYYYKVV
ncbi:MAG: hypothetical protein JWN12_477 [Candidatus Saccharibacteria bacterium]|nr:hypothetical protein [Candidatus Saccharibacteria bacterium]